MLIYNLMRFKAYPKTLKKMTKNKIKIYKLIKERKIKKYRNQ